ncbi:MAG: ferrous iron transport protein A [Clostridia bacterium]|nr:ferrous iron transport protein A [Clostridia bacterium]
MNLIDLKIGEQGVITTLNETLYGIERIKELGLTVGSKIKVVRFSPFNDPVLIEIRGYRLILRVKDAKKIGVRLFEKDLSNR